MKIWKLIGVITICLALVSLIGCGEAEKESAPDTQTEPEVVEMAVTDYTPTAEEIGTEISCGVCGMKMAVTEDMPAVTYDGKSYFFCSDDEKAKFAAAPAEFMEIVDEVVEEAKDKIDEAVGQ